MQYLAHWAKKLSWKEVALSFRTSWEKVFSSVEYVVEWGLKHRDLSNIRAVGVDEIQRSKGHKYLTLVYQIDSGSIRLLWVGADRTAKTFLRFFRFLVEERSRNLQYICSFMLKYTQWILLKRPENLTQKQGIRLRDILRYNLKTIRAYLLKEDFQWFWEYVSPYWAGIFLD